MPITPSGGKKKFDFDSHRIIPKKSKPVTLDGGLKTRRNAQ